MSKIFTLYLQWQCLVSAGETLHGTHKSVGRVQAEQQVNEDSVVREYLHKIYFFDYLIFNFDTNHLDDEYKQLLTSWKLFK